MHEHGCRSNAQPADATEYDDPRGTGQRLAAWLETLGLAEALADAGLPTFERDPEVAEGSVGGTVRWHDPATGRPMTPDQLDALDAMLHADGEDPAHAVPLALVQLRRQAQVRAALLDQPRHSFATLAALRGASENATRFAVHKAAQRGALLVIAHEGDSLIPAFQLADDGELRPELGAVLEPLLGAGMDPWRVWAWLTQPAGLLGGQVPHEAARDAEEVALVRHAAVRLAERATAGTS